MELCYYNQINQKFIIINICTQPEIKKLDDIGLGRSQIRDMLELVVDLSYLNTHWTRTLNWWAVCGFIAADSLSLLQTNHHIPLIQSWPVHPPDSPTTLECFTYLPITFYNWLIIYKNTICTKWSQYQSLKFTDVENHWEMILGFGNANYLLVEWRIV